MEKVHVHHHFIINAASNLTTSRAIDLSASSSSRIDLFATQDLTLSSAGNLFSSSSSGPSRHEHVWHRLRGDEDVDELRRKEKALRPDCVHHFLCEYRLASSSSLQAGGLLDGMQGLRRALRWAHRVEMCAIPPYLYALWSCQHPKGDAAKILRSIAAEEMLHAALAGNILAAVGGVAVWWDQKGVRKYPADVPHVDGLKLRLLPMGRECVEQFRRLEEPGESAGEGGRRNVGGGDGGDEEWIFASIGQLYGAIEEALEREYKQHGDDMFIKGSSVQLGSEHYKVVDMNGEASGGLKRITNIQEAREALWTVVGQGEGVSGQWADEDQTLLAHWKKIEMLDQLVDETPVWPMPCDPRVPNEGEDAVGAALEKAFGASYACLLATLQESTCDGDGNGRLRSRIYIIMEKLMRPLAMSMAMRGQGPTFIPRVFKTSDILEETKQLAKEALAADPKNLSEKMAPALDKLTK